MTMRVSACAMSFALLVGTAAFSTLAAAQNGGVGYNENAYGYSGGGYVGGHSVTGLIDVAVEPMAVEPMALPAPSGSRIAHWNYCAARYRSFDPASDTFLAAHGNRHFCR
jgi:hypothetical protein